MKHLAIAIATALMLAGMIVTPAAAATSPNCGSDPELRAYDQNNEQGLLGILCPQFVGLGADENYGNTTGAFRGSDNDAQNSFRFYNPTSVHWCVVFSRDDNYAGPYIYYDLGHSDTYWVAAGGTMPSGFNNEITSVQIYKRSGGSCI